MTELLNVAGIGLLVGTISALLGLGGGILMVPLLPLAAVMPQREVIATSLLTIWLVVTNNSISFHRTKLVNWNVAYVVGLSSAFWAYLAGRSTELLSENILKGALAIVLCVFAFRVFFSNKPEVSIDETKEGFWAQMKSGKGKTSVFLGVFAGSVSGFTGIGSGMILGPSLIHFQMVPNRKVSPTSNGIMVFTALMGVLAYTQGKLPDFSDMRWGLVHLDKVLVLFGGAFLTSQLFRKYQERISSKARKKILGILLLGLGIKVLWQMFG